MPLFHRQTRTLRLTEASQAALPSLSQGFDKQVQGVEQLRAHGKGSVLTISLSPLFCAMRLVPPG